MSLLKGPKLRSLTQNESLNTIEIWKQNIIFSLRGNESFKPFMKEDFKWGKKSRGKPTRDLVSDTDGLSAEDKCILVDLLLDQIANFCPVIPRNDIIKDCADLDSVWQRIRLFFNLQSTGSLLNECWNIKRGQDETPQALYARLKQCYDDNLLCKNGLEHIDGKLTEDEELSPTLHNTIVLHWLQLLHPRLRDLVTQRFATELRNMTYAALFPEISRSLDGLLNEVNDDASACRTSIPPRRGSIPFRDKPTSYASYQSKGKSFGSASYQKKVCDYCRIMGKRAFSTHNIDECLFLKKSRAVVCDDEGGDEISDHYDEFFAANRVAEAMVSEENEIVEHVINRLTVNASPVMTLLHHDQPYNITLDTGATCNLIRESSAKEMRCNIRPTNQRARMADGKTDLEVLGETDLEFHRNQKVFKMNALVCRVTDTNVLAGMSFMKENDVGIRPATDEIIIDGCEIIKYDPHKHNSSADCRLVSTFTIQSPSRNIILPGQSISLPIPPIFRSDDQIAIEPRFDTYYNVNHSKELSPWPTPSVCKVDSGSISLTNDTKETVIIKKHEVVCSVIPCCTNNLPPMEYDANVCHIPHVRKSELYSKLVKLNPEAVLSKEEESNIKELMISYDEVFNPTISKYNGKSGNCVVEVNMGKNLPPQRKGRVPFYGKNNLKALQDKFDELKMKGVFARPQDIGITIENVNPSFLVKKPNGGERLVTDFNSIASYCRPTPSVMPNVDSTLRKIASWKYIICTDLTEAYFQIPLKRSSMKYCGVVTPATGLLVYCSGCMGLPGVEVALEELTCLLFGDLVMEGVVAKVADDLFIGGDSPSELISNFGKVLQILLDNNLKLSARKTVIAPKSITILGWIWSSGKLRASPHRLTGLSECDPPMTVSAMRSFLGAYRILSRVIKGYAVLLSPLEAAIKGKSSGGDKIEWSDELKAAFRTAQIALKDSKTLTLPIPSDTLWIVTDAAVRPSAVGATMYVVRSGKTLLSEFYNSKLPPFQQKWLPCEVEGLAISAALKHFAPFIVQSEHKPHVLTDSKACVQAVEKLSRGEFSASARLCTFLSSVSRYGALVKHISGSVNLLSDFSSRNPLSCDNVNCQVCLFIKDTATSVVCNLVSADILQGRVKLPFTNRRAWKDIQRECPDLRKVISHKEKGTQPNKKAKNLRTVRRYLSSKVLVAHDGVLVCRNAEPLSQVIEQIVVPSQTLHGLLTVLHLKLNHPTAHQLTLVFQRYFYALNLKNYISDVTKSCHQCASLLKVPTAMISQSSDPPPASVGVKFAADVLKRCKQKILVIRECVTSYTLAELIENETSVEVSNKLIMMCAILRPSSLSQITVRVDPAPAHQCLFKDLNGSSTLKSKGIILELGRTLNVNKNPVAEKALNELLREIKVISPESQQISELMLSGAIANLNSRIRASGLSSHELWTQRDQITGDQLPINDREVIISQYKRRISNHHASELSKSHGKPPRNLPKVQIGSLVYLYNDNDKESARQRYIVTEINNEWCKLRKFSSKLFGIKVYDARLDECYCVPPYDYTREVIISSDDSSDSEEEYTPEFHQSSDTAESQQDETFEPDPPAELVGQQNDANEIPLPPTRRKSTRNRKPPDRFKDYECNGDSLSE